MAKIKGITHLKVESDECVSVWEGKAKDCVRSFSVLMDHVNQYFLYQDGRLIEVNADLGLNIYPFSKNPQKKPGIFAKSACNHAKIVCVSTDFDQKLLWGTQSAVLVMDRETGKPCTVGGTGHLFYRIIERGANRFYQKLYLAHGNSRKVNKALSGMIAEIFAGAVSASTYPLHERTGLTAEERSEISKVMMAQLKPVFSDYGMELLPISEISLVRNVVIHQGTPDEVFPPQPYSLMF